METDATHGDYDARLAHWLRETEVAHGFAERLPFPRHHGIADAALRRDYRTATLDLSLEGTQRLHLSLPNDAQVESLPLADDLAAGPATVARIHLPSADASIDVAALRMPAAADLGDWLEEWLPQTGMIPISSRPRLTASGTMGDVLATQRTDDGITVARYATVRLRDHTFVLVLRSPLANYRLVARDFVLALTSCRASNAQPTTAARVAST